MSASTVVRTIAGLEERLGIQLFSRLPEGIALTSEGQALLPRARAMEQEIFGAMRVRGNLGDERVAVSVSVTEGLGSYWIVPRLVRFQRQNPSFLVRMRCAMDSADVLRLEADMSIQFDRPENPELIVAKLGRLHIYPFASRGYLATYGTPANAGEMRHHRLVQQIAPQIDDDVWARELGLADPSEIVSLSTNASTSILYAIENGGGIGGLPTYVGALNDRIVPVDIGIRHQMDIWLTYHPGLRRDARKMRFVEWIRDIFDGTKHPWFSDQFIHPAQLPKTAFEDG